MAIKRRSLENAADVPADMLERARQGVAVLFNHAGIRLSWVGAALCPKRRLSIRIVTKSIGVTGQNPDSLGVASGGTVAWVFYHRIAGRSAAWRIDAAQMLSHVIAHEMGHLLLPYPAHALVGVMRPEWDRAQAEAATGALTFTRDQVKLIRQRLSACASPIARAR